MAQQVGVEVRVERERAGLRHADEPLRVEQQPPAERRAARARRRRSRCGGAAPRGATRRGAGACRRLVEAPRLADRVDVHRARAVGVVGEREGASSRRRSASAAGRPSAASLRWKLRAVGVAALREEHAPPSPSARSARPRTTGRRRSAARAPATMSRERCPITPSGRIDAGKPYARDARTRARTRRRSSAATRRCRRCGGWRLREAARPEAEPLRLRDPLVEREADEPGRRSSPAARRGRRRCRSRL